MTVPAAYDVSNMELVMDADGVVIHAAPAGPNMTLGWFKCAAGTDFGPAVKGLDHDMCCCEHWGFIVKGRMDVVTHDGHSISLRAGQPFHLLPGHMPTFPEDCEWFDFSPKDQVDRLFTHMGLG